jgi:two-component system sensor histidine kinase/response regulator
MKEQRVMIVDDEERNVKLLKAMLMTEEYHTLGVFRGEDALGVVPQFRPDLILLDAMMPGLNGFEVCRRLKEDESTRAIPVLMVTALREREHKVRAMEAGADDFLSKPVDKAELLIRVKSLLRIKRYHDELLSSYTELAEKSQRLRELEKTKEGLIHMVIHDLKNPLTVVKAAMEMLLLDEEQIQESQLRFVERALDSCRDMDRQIESLVTIHRMENAGLALERTRVDITAMVEDVLDEFKVKADSRGISLFSASQDDVVYAELDGGLMQRVVANLLSNAIRHTAAGGRVSVYVASHPEHGKLLVRVRDAGEGLPREYLEKVFDKFEQVKLRREGVVVGSSGLGLAFCKMVVEAHGGKIWAESEGEGKGCTFAFEIPPLGEKVCPR